ncbi:radical SAM protein [Candidatus Woesearchaeota archaeon]|jgi:radical SAM superfamily enzyme YgiQ (UPF0313 family)|nr:radical SAM protein [Candidatus Woesearchaeota archaeon]MBT6519155.1 radical SAM protein [Candidatus Woesearchaeota archaeon]
MKLLLVYPPFCTPSILPYSISYLKSFVKDNLDVDVKCLDLNAKFHKLKFKKYYSELNQTEIKKSIEKTGEILFKFNEESKPVYRGNNNKVVRGEEPELIKELIQLIIDEKPDLVGFSVVYNSQCFYATVFLNELRARGINCVVGGPSANEKMRSENICLKNEVELVEYIEKTFDVVKKYSGHCNCSTVNDYLDYSEDDYLCSESIIPLKTCSTCFYRQCAFCTHYKDEFYFEYELENIKKTIVNSGKKYFFLIDDMVSIPRIIQLAKIFKELKVIWSCQLKPTTDLIDVLPQLYESGLRCVCWGVESGNQRVLDLMKKGTKINEVKDVLIASSKIGIKNIAFIMFGFPGETETEFKDTIKFLKDNSDNIDLVSTSIFGLQKGSKVYNNPEEYGIVKITEKPRTILDERISFTVDAGMTPQRVAAIKDNYSRTIQKLDKLPRIFNYFKEQIMLFD